VRSPLSGLHILPTGVRWIPQIPIIRSDIGGEGSPTHSHQLASRNHQVLTPLKPMQGEVPTALAAHTRATRPVAFPAVPWASLIQEKCWQKGRHSGRACEDQYTHSPVSHMHTLRGWAAPLHPPLGSHGKLAGEQHEHPVPKNLSLQCLRKVHSAVLEPNLPKQHNEQL